MQRVRLPKEGQHFLTCIKQTGFDGVLWHTNDFGGFGKRQLMVVNQIEYFAMYLGQSLDALT